MFGWIYASHQFGAAFAAWAAGASITRDGDWIEFALDDEGDPKWSDQAAAFYVAIAPFVRSGTVEIRGEDGARWSYTYADGQVSTGTVTAADVVNGKADVAAVTAASVLGELEQTINGKWITHPPTRCPTDRRGSRPGVVQAKDARGM